MAPGQLQINYSEKGGYREDEKKGKQGYCKGGDEA
jgi:hypothetical protein